MTKQLFIRLCWRFGRAFLAGAVGTMATLAGFTGSSWKDLGVWLAALGMAAIVGGIAGLIQALDLYLRN